MKPRRADRVAEVLRKEIALLLLHESKDPRTTGVVVTGVRVSDDLRTAMIRFVLEDPALDREEAAKGLGHAAGFLRSRLRERVSLRIMPELKFVYDTGLDHERRVEALLHEIGQEEKVR